MGRALEAFHKLAGLLLTLSGLLLALIVTGNICGSTGYVACFEEKVLGRAPVIMQSPQPQTVKVEDSTPPVRPDLDAKRTPSKTPTSGRPPGIQKAAQRKSSPPPSYSDDFWGDEPTPSN
jgi:hypothetical protein